MVFSVLERRWPGRGRYGIARADAWIVALFGTARTTCWASTRDRPISRACSLLWRS